MHSPKSFECCMNNALVECCIYALGLSEEKKVNIFAFLAAHLSHMTFDLSLIPAGYLHSARMCHRCRAHVVLISFPKLSGWECSPTYNYLDVSVALNVTASQLCSSSCVGGVYSRSDTESPFQDAHLVTKDTCSFFHTVPLIFVLLQPSRF